MNDSQDRGVPLAEDEWMRLWQADMAGTPDPACSLRAGDGTRTRDPQLGRLMLYQLSYTRDQFVRPACPPSWWG